MNLALRIALEAEGLSAAEIAAVDAALPAVRRLLAAGHDLAPIIQKVWPELQPALPIAVKAWPDLVMVWPVLQRLARLAEGAPQ